MCVELVRFHKGLEVWWMGSDGFPTGVVELLEEREVGRVGRVAVVPDGLSIMGVFAAFQTLASQPLPSIENL